MALGEVFRDKRAARTALRARRDALAHGLERGALQQALSGSLAAFLDSVASLLPPFLPEARVAPRVASYLPLGSEFNLNATATPEWLFPRVGPGSALTWFRLGSDPTRLAVNAFGILEAPMPECVPCFATPQAPWVVLVPALACDEDHVRLGYGGGYYDRFLALHTEAVLAVCVVPEKARVLALPCDPHDVCVDVVVTERAVRVRERAARPHRLSARAH